MNLSLSRITALVTLLDNPAKDQCIIHIAGTNGKGSTIAFMAAVLMASGYKTGQYNSPYYWEPSDCVLVNGSTSSLYLQIHEQVSHLSQSNNLNCTPFEIDTATAFVIFKMENVDVVLLEVGLGGRLDATNVISPPKLAVITSISMDHMEYLGNSIQDITREKCGIIKSGTDSVIVSHQEFNQVYDIIDTFSQLAESKVLKVDLNDSSQDDTSIMIDYFSERIIVPLKLRGHHQVNNAYTALLTLSRLEKIDLNFRFSPQNIKTGMENVIWPGRMEKLFYKNRDILVDGAHNVAGAKNLKKFVKDFKNITWVLGFSQNKDVAGILNVLLEKNDVVIALGFESPVNMPWVKCMDPLIISSMCTLHTKNVTIANDFDDALKINHNSTIVVCGSLYLVAQVSRKIHN